MQVEIKARHESYARIELKTDNYERLQTAVSNVSNGYISNRGGMRMHKALREIFEGHSDFYDYADFDASNSHGANGTTFDTTGFGEFLSDYFESDKSYVDYIDDEDVLQQLSDIIAEKIADILQEYEENLDGDSYAASSMVTLDAEESTELHDPKLVKDSLLVTEDGVHKIKTQKLQDATSMEEIEDKIKDGMKDVYKNQVDARVNSMKNRIKTLETRIEEEKQEMLVEGLQMVGELDNWEIEGNYLVYQERVHPEWVQKKFEDGQPVKLTEEAQEKFYIDGLKVKITQNPKNLYFEDAYHPHALDETRTCTGSFQFPLREAVERAVKQVKHIDLHSRGHCDAERDFLNNFEEYTVGSEEEEEDAEDVDAEQETLGEEENPESEEAEEAEVFTA